MGITGRVNYWTRTDLGTNCFRSSPRTGPDWRIVHGRMTACAQTGKVIEEECWFDTTRESEHKRFPRQVNTDTVFL